MPLDWRSLLGLPEASAYGSHTDNRFRETCCCASPRPARAFQMPRINTTGEDHSAFIVAIIQQASNRVPLLVTLPARYTERKGAHHE